MVVLETVEEFIKHVVMVVFNIREFSGNRFDGFVFLSNSESESGSNSAGEFSKSEHSSLGLKGLDEG